MTICFRLSHVKIPLLCFFFFIFCCISATLTFAKAAESVESWSDIKELLNTTDTEELQLDLNGKTLFVPEGDHKFNVDDSSSSETTAKYKTVSFLNGSLNFEQNANVAFDINVQDGQFILEFNEMSLLFNENSHFSFSVNENENEKNNNNNKNKNTHMMCSGNIFVSFIDVNVSPIDALNSNGEDDSLTLISLRNITKVEMKHSTLDGNNVMGTLLHVEMSSEHHALLEDSLLQNAKNMALRIAEKAHLKLENTNVMNNGNEKGDGAILLDNKATLSMTGGILENNKGKDGGGVHLDSDAEAMLNNVFFKNNSAEYGGGVRVLSGTLKIENSIFEGNHASLDGGGVAIEDNSDLFMFNVTMINNNADGKGGAVLVTETQVSITQTLFTNNSAKEGGGVCINPLSKDDSTISDSKFFNNNATASGGGLNIFRGISGLNLRNVDFIGNNATDGGGIYLNSRSTTTISNSIMQQNIATKTGGAVYYRRQDGAVLEINADTMIFENKAQDGGGIAVDFDEDPLLDSSSSISTSTSSSSISNTISSSSGSNEINFIINNLQFYNNTATINGGALFINSFLDINAELINTTFTSNIAEEGDGGCIFTATIPNIKWATLGMISCEAPKGYGGGIFVSTRPSDNPLKIPRFDPDPGLGQEGCAECFIMDSNVGYGVANVSSNAFWLMPLNWVLEFRGYLSQRTIPPLEGHVSGEALPGSPQFQVLDVLASLMFGPKATEASINIQVIHIDPFSSSPEFNSSQVDPQSLKMENNTEVIFDANEFKANEVQLKANISGSLDVSTIELFSFPGSTVTLNFSTAYKIILIPDPENLEFINSFVVNVTTEPCVPGQYLQEVNGRTFVCANCTDNRYSDMFNSVSCKVCNKTNFIVTNDRTACECASGDCSVEQRNVSTELKWAMGVLSGFAAVIVLVLLVLVLIYWNRPIVKAATPPFLIVMIVGGLLGCISAVLLGTQDSDVVCMLQPWFLSFAFVLLFGSMLAKNYRIWRVFRKRFKSPRNVPQLRHLMAITSVMLAIDIIILILWTSIDPFKSNLVDVEGEQITYYKCSSKSDAVWLSALLVYKGILLVLGVALAIATRNVHQLFNESKWIGLASYAMAALAIIFLPIYLFIEQQPDLRYAFGSVGILLAVLCGLLLLLMYKFITVWRGKDVITNHVDMTVKKKRSNSTSGYDENKRHSLAM